MQNRKARQSVTTSEVTNTLLHRPRENIDPKSNHRSRSPRHYFLLVLVFLSTIAAVFMILIGHEINESTHRPMIETATTEHRGNSTFRLRGPSETAVSKKRTKENIDDGEDNHVRIVQSIPDARKFVDQLSQRRQKQDNNSNDVFLFLSCPVGENWHALCTDSTRHTVHQVLTRVRQDNPQLYIIEIHFSAREWNNPMHEIHRSLQFMVLPAHFPVLLKWRPLRSPEKDGYLAGRSLLEPTLVTYLMRGQKRPRLPQVSTISTVKELDAILFERKQTQQDRARQPAADGEAEEEGALYLFTFAGRKKGSSITWCPHCREILLPIEYSFLNASSTRDHLIRYEVADMHDFPVFVADIPDLRVIQSLPSLDSFDDDSVMIESIQQSYEYVPYKRQFTAMADLGGFFHSWNKTQHHVIVQSAQEAWAIYHQLSRDKTTSIFLFVTCPLSDHSETCAKAMVTVREVLEALENQDKSDDDVPYVIQVQFRKPRETANAFKKKKDDGEEDELDISNPDDYPVLLRWRTNVTEQEDRYLEGLSVTHREWVAYLLTEGKSRQPRVMSPSIERITTRDAFEAIVSQEEERRSDTGKVYFVFVSGRGQTGSSNVPWCRYCRLALLPLEYMFLTFGSFQDRLVVIEVSETYENWHDPDNPFKHIERITPRAESVPDLRILDHKKALGGAQVREFYLGGLDHFDGLRAVFGAWNHHLVAQSIPEARQLVHQLSQKKPAQTHEVFLFLSCSPTSEPWAPLCASAREAVHEVLATPSNVYVVIEVYFSNQIEWTAAAPELNMRSQDFPVLWKWQHEMVDDDNNHRPERRVYIEGVSLTHRSFVTYLLNHQTFPVARPIFPTIDTVLIQTKQDIERLQVDLERANVASSSIDTKKQVYLVFIPPEPQDSSNLLLPDTLTYVEYMFLQSSSMNDRLIRVRVVSSALSFINDTIKTSDQNPLQRILSNLNDSATLDLRRNLQPRVNQTQANNVSNDPLTLQFEKYDALVQDFGALRTFFQKFMSSSLEREKTLIRPHVIVNTTTEALALYDQMIMSELLDDDETPVSIFLFLTCSRDNPWKHHCKRAGERVPYIFEQVRQETESKKKMVLIEVQFANASNWTTGNFFQRERTIHVLTEHFPVLMKWRKTPEVERDVYLEGRSTRVEELITYVFHDQTFNVSSRAAMDTTESLPKIHTISNVTDMEALVSKRRQDVVQARSVGNDDEGTTTTRGELYFYFVSGVVSVSNVPWCGYCRLSNAIIEHSFLQYAAREDELIRIEVAATIQAWHGPENPFKQVTDVQTVPTLRRVVVSHGEDQNLTVTYEKLNAPMDRIAQVQHFFYAPRIRQHMIVDSFEEAQELRDLVLRMFIQEPEPGQEKPSTPPPQIFLFLNCGTETDWHSSCTTARENVRRTSAPSWVYVIEVHFRSKVEWKAKSNPFHQRPEFKVNHKHFPVLMRWKTDTPDARDAYLEGGALQQQELIGYLFDNETLNRTTSGDLPKIWTITTVAEFHTILDTRWSSNSSMSLNSSKVLTPGGSGGQLYFYFVAGPKVSTGLSWCPYCRLSATVVEYAFLKYASATDVLVRIEVSTTYGDWKSPDNPFKHELEIRYVPDLRLVVQEPAEPAVATVVIREKPNVEFQKVDEDYDDLPALQQVFEPPQVQHHVILYNAIDAWTMFDTLRLSQRKIILFLTCDSSLWDPSHCQEAKKVVQTEWAEIIRRQENQTLPFLIEVQFSSMSAYQDSIFVTHRDLKFTRFPVLVHWLEHTRTSMYLSGSYLVDVPEAVRYSLSGQKATTRRPGQRVIQLESPDKPALDEILEENRGSTQNLYLFFISGVHPESNRPWCPSCRVKDLGTEFLFYRAAPADAVLVKIRIADTYPEFKRKDNPYKKDPRLGVHSVPFLGRWNHTSQQLEPFRGNLKTVDVVERFFDGRV